MSVLQSQKRRRLLPAASRRIWETPLQSTYQLSDFDRLVKLIGRLEKLNDVPIDAPKAAIST